MSRLSIDWWRCLSARRTGTASTSRLSSRRMRGAERCRGSSGRAECHPAWARSPVADPPPARGEADCDVVIQRGASVNVARELVDQLKGSSRACAPAPCGSACRAGVRDPAACTPGEMGGSAGVSGCSLGVPVDSACRCRGRSSHSAAGCTMPLLGCGCGEARNGLEACASVSAGGIGRTGSAGSLSCAIIRRATTSGVCSHE
mmetsp:Transcript_8722/g.22572  ORF Transcript_8722/g.22572 Transcript_8722/m.22572 type:complete len:203 (-) Transcript_8722:31-639(-)